MQWEPAEGKDKDKAEDGFGHFPPLKIKKREEKSKDDKVCMMKDQKIIE